MPPGPHYRGNVYSALKDILQRVPQIDDSQVYYRPSSADKCYLEAYIHPERVDLPAGPGTPRVTVKWTQQSSPDEFRIDYSDPNIQFYCGWHQDEDHPEYGALHFQYNYPSLDEPVYRAVSFGARRRLGSYGRHSITSSLKSFSRSQHPSLLRARITYN